MRLPAHFKSASEMQSPTRFPATAETNYTISQGRKHEPDMCCHAFGHGMSRFTDLRERELLGHGRSNRLPALQTPLTFPEPRLLLCAVLRSECREGGVSRYELSPDNERQRSPTTFGFGFD